MNQPLRIGTRGSPLALAQARMVADALGALGHATEIVPITTTGDVVQDRPLAEIGGKALWTKELDRALVEGRTDLSVHSMKDVETIRPDSLAIAAMLPRADPRDRLIGAERIAGPARRRGGRHLVAAPRRAIAGAAARPQHRHPARQRPDPARQGRERRDRRDPAGCGGAGPARHCRRGRRSTICCPAPAQGAIGVEILSARDDLRDLLAAIDDRPTSRCVRAERALLAALGGDCHSAVAARASIEGDAVRLDAEILSADGREVQCRIAAARWRRDAGRPRRANCSARRAPRLRAMFGR